MDLSRYLKLALIKNCGSQEFTWSGAMEDYLPVGPGFATYNNGDEYWGSYYDGKRNSYGRYTFMKTGANYEGNYTDNLKSGFGIFTYPDRSVYTGIFMPVFFRAESLHGLFLIRQCSTKQLRYLKPCIFGRSRCVCSWTCFVWGALRRDSELQSQGGMWGLQGHGTKTWGAEKDSIRMRMATYTRDSGQRIKNTVSAHTSSRKPGLK